jgi:hypothetical protein
MQDMTAAFLVAQERLFDAIVAHGGFSWTMTTPHSEIDQLRLTNNTAKCIQTLDTMCKWYGPMNTSAWVYTVDPGSVMQPGEAERYIALFLLARGDYAWQGYGWIGCTDKPWPRPPEWDLDYGVPENICSETSAGSGVYRREYTKASVAWDCRTHQGTVTRKQPRDVMLALPVKSDDSPLV